MGQQMEAAGRLLVKTASALQQAGDFSGALLALRQAVLKLEDGGELRERFGVAFLLVMNLCHLGRFEEAWEGLEDVRRLVRGWANERDESMVAWLGARVDAGLGRDDEARAGLAEVLDQLARRGDDVDAAVVSLELAAIDLAAGRTAEVKALAGEMVWIVSTAGIEHDALDAMRLFWEAAAREQATVEQARQLLGQNWPDWGLVAYGCEEAELGGGALVQVAWPSKARPAESRRQRAGEADGYPGGLLRQVD